MRRSLVNVAMSIATIICFAIVRLANTVGASSQPNQTHAEVLILLRDSAKIYRLNPPRHSQLKIFHFLTRVLNVAQITRTLVFLLTTATRELLTCLTVRGHCNKLCFGLAT